MESDIVANMIGNIGVPAAVCFYTLFEVNRNIKRLTEAINELTRVTSDMDKRLDKLEKDVLALQRRKS